MSDLIDLIRQIHASPFKGIFALTGGGIGAMYELQKRGGGSATVIEMIEPYAMESFVDFVRCKPEKFCSEGAARILAMAAFQKARHLTKDADRDHLFGLGATCSLSKGILKDERQGREHRLCIAYQTANETFSFETVLKPADREKQEDALIRPIIEVIAKACGLKVAHPDPLFSDPAAIRHSATSMDPILTSLLWSTSNLAKGMGLVYRNGSFAVERIEAGSYLLPGSFNPLHDGHRGMKNYVLRKDPAAKVYYELSLTNVDKPGLDYVEIIKRLSQFEEPVLLTNLPRTIAKAEHYRNCNIIVGFDTWQRIKSTMYYNWSPAERDATLEYFNTYGTKFIIFGRTEDNLFRNVDGADSTDNPLTCNIIREVVAEKDFRIDLSSTQLRKAAR